MKSRVWPVVFVLCLCFGVATLYFEAGSSSLDLSSRATKTAMSFNELKVELNQAKGEKDSGLVSSWKARAELLALEGVPLTTLVSIYRKLLSLEFTDALLRGRIKSAVQKLERLQQGSFEEAVLSLGETLTRLARERRADQRESVFGELDVLEIYFYRQYQTDPTGKIEALFYAGKAAHARYFQGLEYINKYLEVCEHTDRCQNVSEAERMKSAHSGLLDQFEE